MTLITTLDGDFMIYFGLFLFDEMGLPKNTIQRFLAGFMAVWLSGVVFLFCCPQIKAAGQADPCPLMKMSSSHCDKAAKQETANNSIERTAPACFECCAFLPVVFDKSRKIDVVQKQALAPVEVVVASKFEFALGPMPAVSSVRGEPRFADRSGTYLVNSVFRI